MSAWQLKRRLVGNILVLEIYGKVNVEKIGIDGCAILGFCSMKRRSPSEVMFAPWDSVSWL